MRKSEKSSFNHSFDAPGIRFFLGEMLPRLSVATWRFYFYQGKGISGHVISKRQVHAGTTCLRIL